MVLKFWTDLGAETAAWKKNTAGHGVSAQSLGVCGHTDVVRVLDHQACHLTNCIWLIRPKKKRVTAMEAGSRCNTQVLLK